MGMRARIARLRANRPLPAQPFSRGCHLFENHRFANVLDGIGAAWEDMIKKLVIAGTLAGSMLVGVPAANASPQECMRQYDAAVTACAEAGQGYGSACEQGAAVVMQDCLKRLVRVDS